MMNNLRRILRHLYSGSVQNRLGYSRNSKLLIIHADDVGLSETENLASFEAMDKGLVNSGSIMVPCSGFSQIAEFCRTRRKADLGVHLTLTSEWSAFKWGPVISPDKVPSLVDENGMFFESADLLVQNFSPEDIKTELTGQIEMALNAGIDLTHIDSHMFTAFSHKDIQNIYVELGEKYRLPVLLSYEFSTGYKNKKDSLFVDHLYYARPKHNVEDLRAYYRQVLRSLKPGLNIILIHPAYKNQEMDDITSNQPKYGSAWRQADFDFFTGNECRQMIEEGDIQLVSWREIREALFR